jgi:hypothetical protein
MAIDLMLHRHQDEKPFYHQLQHDLESVLYVILWICTSMEAPGIERRVADPRFMDVPLRMWFDKDADIQNLGYLKLGHIVDAERAILQNFPPFWNSFKPFVRQLLKAFFPIHPIAGCEITAQGMIDILKDAARQVDTGEDGADDITSLENGDAGAASYNEIFYETTAHSYLAPRTAKRAREEESGLPQQFKKGKKNTDIINFENWNLSLEARHLKASHQPVSSSSSRIGVGSDMLVPAST